MQEHHPFQTIHEALGARFAEVGGRPVPRSYGDTAAEYEAIRSGAGLVDRSDRIPFRVYGRDPVKILHGLVTNDLAGAPDGQGVYAALLTPKGRMLADLRLFRRAAGDVLVDVDAGALDNVLATFKKYVPPLFARYELLDGELRVLGVYGPDARELVGRVVGEAIPAGLAEDAFVCVDDEGHELLIARTEYTGDEGYDIYAPVGVAERLWHALVEAGARPVGHATLDVLRIEAGRPRWGTELDDSVFPLEAGLRDRAISTTKGCYTGQEVIIRILHRGRVNWHLRGLLLGDAPVPARGTQLFRTGEDKPVGRITSACESPRHGQAVALGYVRREVEPPAVLRLGAGDGPEVRVFELPLPIGA